MLSVSLTNPGDFKAKALQWAAGFDVCCLLDSNHFDSKYSAFDALIAAGVKDEICTLPGQAFDALEKFRRKYPGWLPGFFTYDLKNECEDLLSSNPDYLNFPGLYFFVPKAVIKITGNTAEIEADDARAVLDAIRQTLIAPAAKIKPLYIKPRFTRDEYLNKVSAIQQHIARGDIYVTNFCQEFFTENAEIQPLDVFTRLNTVSPNPFASFFRLRDKYMLCASPERFLAKRGVQLISQPIKGTARRGADEAEDEAIIRELRNQTKEQQENVMIVDLVRNDLTRSAKPGTVVTEELFGIYTFSQVHQMISTIVCEKAEDISDVQAIRHTFPMGSMTGAPKVSAMRLMEQYERSRRGLYSGAAGYFGPDGDFDFNVVIRTILYNATAKYLSFQAGSAITWQADAEKEYEECLLKVKAIMQVLGQF